MEKGCRWRKVEHGKMLTIKKNMGILLTLYIFQEIKMLHTPRRDMGS